MSKFKVGQIIKYSEPLPGEEDLRFRVIEVHEADAVLGEKILIEIVTEDSLKPTFHHFAKYYIHAEGFYFETIKDQVL